METNIEDSEVVLLDDTVEEDDDDDEEEEQDIAEESSSSKSNVDEQSATASSPLVTATVEDDAVVRSETTNRDNEEELEEEESMSHEDETPIGDDNCKTPTNPILFHAYAIKMEPNHEIGSEAAKEMPPLKPGGNKLNSDESSPSQAGLLGSVMKTDLGEILRRSCRERKTNTRFSNDSIVPGMTSPDGTKSRSNTSARQKGKQSTPASSPTSTKNAGGGIRLVSVSRAGVETKIQSEQRSGKISSETMMHKVRSGKFNVPTKGYISLDQLAADDQLMREAIEGGKRLVIKRHDKARKSFKYDTETGECVETSGGGSDSAVLVMSSNSGRSSYSFHGRTAAASKLKQKRRFFKGSTYHLSHSRAYRKKKKPVVGEGGDQEEGSVTSEASSSAMTSGMESFDGGESSKQNSIVDNDDEAAESLFESSDKPSSSQAKFPNDRERYSRTSNEMDKAGVIKIINGNDESMDVSIDEDDDDEDDDDEDDTSVDSARVRGGADMFHRIPVETILSIKSDASDNDNIAGPKHPFMKRKRSSDGSTKSVSSKTSSAKNKHTSNVNSNRLTPFKMPKLQNGESKKVTSITMHQSQHMRCACRTLDGAHLVPNPSGNFCQGIDCIDNRLIGCINTAPNKELLRPASRIPFQALCEVHRQRMRLHQCCPGCGLFCTQGSFIQCRADPRKAIHHAHKDCLLIEKDKEICPHCGEGTHLQEVTFELNAPRSLGFFHKQNPFRKDGKPGARMAFSRGNDYSKPSDYADTAFARSYKFAETGKEISSAGLPLGPDRSQLEEILANLSTETPTHLNYKREHMAIASKTGDVEKVLHMLMLGFDPNMKFEEYENCTPLHLAASNGHLVLTHVLVQASASLDSMDANLQTPLMFAIEDGKLHIAQYLIKAGAQLDARGEDGMTVLHLAAKAGQLQACRLILDTGKVNGNIQDDGGWTPLVWAAEHRHLAVVKFLLERGTDPNLRDNEHNIALHWSAFSGSIEISEIFLNHGCDINSANDHNDTPLHIAARQDKYECVMLFLARNADVDSRNKDGETPLMCCPDQNSQTWLALSMTKHLKKISVSRTIRTERILHQDITRGKEQNPIQCINGVDDEPAPDDFVYICENCETTPINMERSITSLQSCHCEDDCSSPNCTCSSMSLKCWYDKEGVLIDEFNLFDPPMIFECNRVCRCWNTCKNRVLQNGITCRFQLFRTKGKGWGVRALRDIPKGTFICEYIGELISDLEADQREDDSYLFDLDNRDGETYCIDARRYGNISRFINHLCEPNVVPVKVFVDYQDLRFPRIALFSSREIRAYEELGFDYGDKFWIIKYKMFTCSCVSEKCKYSSETIHDTLANYNRRQTEEQEETFS